MKHSGRIIVSWYSLIVKLNIQAMIPGSGPDFDAQWIC